MTLEHFSFHNTVMLQCLSCCLILLSVVKGWYKYIYPYILVYECVCVYIYIYIHSLTGHFVRYTLLVLGWTPFVFRTALILRGIDSTRCWKHSSEILVHIDMRASRSCCRFVGYTSMMQISVPPHPKDCGGHLRKVNSLSCSRNQSEIIWALWHISLVSNHQKMVHCSYKGMDMVSNNIQVGCGV